MQFVGIASLTFMLSANAMSCDSCPKIGFDTGQLEFLSQPTCTCLAIGPDLSTGIAPITGQWNCFDVPCRGCCVSGIFP